LKAEARANLLKLQFTWLLLFGRKKLDATHTRLPPKIDIGLAYRRSNRFLVLDPVSRILFVRWDIAIVIHEVKREFASIRGADADTRTVTGNSKWLWLVGTIFMTFATIVFEETRTTAKGSTIAA
jgi:hypothetical protein